MKKIFLAFTALSLLISCSSDNEKEELIPPEPKPLKQYEVNYTVSKNELEEKEKNLVVDLENSHQPFLGLSGIYIVFKSRTTTIDPPVSVLSDECVVFDRSCPYEWDKNTLLKVRYIDYNTVMECDICGSRYSSLNMEAISGKAKEKALKLIQYKVDFDKGKQEYQITNPNYKKK